MIACKRCGREHPDEVYYWAPWGNQNLRRLGVHCPACRLAIRAQTTAWRAGNRKAAARTIAMASLAVPLVAQACGARAARSVAEAVALCRWPSCPKRAERLVGKRSDKVLLCRRHVRAYGDLVAGRVDPHRRTRQQRFEEDLASVPEVPTETPGAVAREDPLTASSRALFWECVDRVLNTLTFREKEVVRMRYGLDDGYTYTREEIAYRFKVSPERIRQVENGAIRKLQHPRRAELLEPFLEEVRAMSCEPNWGSPQIDEPHRVNGRIIRKRGGLGSEWDC